MAYNENQGRKFCCEDLSLVENFDKANASEEVYAFHHRLETDLGVTRAWLKENNLYYNRPANELILVTKADHMKLHHKGKPKTEEHKAKIAESKLGKPRPRSVIEKLRSVNIGSKHTEEHKAKIAAASKALARSKDNYVCPLVLFTLYSVKNKSIKEIALELNVSAQTVRKNLRKYNIHRSEASQN